MFQFVYLSTVLVHSNLIDIYIYFLGLKCSVTVYFHTIIPCIRNSTKNKNIGNNKNRGQVRSIPRLHLYNEFSFRTIVPFSHTLPFILLVFGSYSDTYIMIIYRSINNTTTQKQQHKKRVGTIDIPIEFYVLFCLRNFVPFSI